MLIYDAHYGRRYVCQLTIASHSVPNSLSTRQQTQGVFLTLFLPCTHNAANPFVQFSQSAATEVDNKFLKIGLLLSYFF